MVREIRVMLTSDVGEYLVIVMRELPGARNVLSMCVVTCVCT